MCEGVREDSRQGAWHVGIQVGMCIFLLECVCDCYCMCTQVGSSPCRRIPLLGIAHPVVGKYFQVLEIHRGMKHIQELSCEKWPDYGLIMYFVKKNIFIQFLFM